MYVERNPSESENGINWPAAQSDGLKTRPRPRIFDIENNIYQLLENNMAK